MTTTHEHIVKSFDSELQRLYGEIVRMGELATSQLDGAVDVMLRRDTKAAQRVDGVVGGGAHQAASRCVAFKMTTDTLVPGNSLS